MSNALDLDLVGKTVIIRTDSLKPEFQADRRFHVRGGFGAKPYTSGRKMYGTWLADGKDDVMLGEDVEALAPEPTDDQP